MTYDIFISYRRKGGYETAKHLFDLLTRDNYAVSFDIDTLRNGNFDLELLKRIDECTDFIVILNQGVFDRCFDPAVNYKNDWLRNELAYALQKNKNIIPVMLEGFTEFPDNLPDDIVEIERRNGPKYDQYYFDNFYAKLKRSFLESYPVADFHSSQFENNMPVFSSILRIKPDLDCRVYKFDEEIGFAKGGLFTAINLRKGVYSLKFVSDVNQQDLLVLDYTMEDNNMEDMLFVSLKPIQDKRMEAEEKEKRRERYQKIYAFHEGLAKVCRGEKYGFINSEIEEVIPCMYESAWDFSHGISRVQNNKKYGFIDKTGKVIIPLKYDNTSDILRDNYIVVVDNNKFGYWLISGEQLTPLKYDKVFLFSEAGVAQVTLNGKRGYINQKGQEIIPCGKYDYVGAFADGLCLVRKDWLYGYLDIYGKEIIPLKYSMANSFYEGKALVGKNREYYMIDKRDTIVKHFTEYCTVCDFFDDRALVQKGGDKGKISTASLSGYIDRTGKEVIPCIYKYGCNFSEGLAGLQKEDKFGYIDVNGNVVIPFIYDYGQDFKNGLACVCKNKKRGFLDKQGKVVIPLIYDESDTFRKGLARVKLNGKYGFLDATGKAVIPIVYDFATVILDNSLISVQLNGEKFYIDVHGNRI